MCVRAYGKSVCIVHFIKFNFIVHNTVLQCANAIRVGAMPRMAHEALPMLASTSNGPDNSNPSIKM